MVTGLLQGVLLVMGLTFEWRNKQKMKAGQPVVDRSTQYDEEEDGDNRATHRLVDDERTPLISDRRSGT